MKTKIEDEVLSILAGNKEFDDARSAANAELIQILAQYLTDYPTQRFGQALANLDIVKECKVPNKRPAWLNGFAEEPQAMLARAKAALKRIKK